MLNIFHLEVVSDLSADAFFGSIPRKLIKSVEVQNFVTQHLVTFWEAGIKSGKTMKSAVLNFEELVTLVTQIEACLNSRPPLSNDSRPATSYAGHFLSVFT
ncbi:hypothetical protein TNCV_479401 [Trichonephila clavipes]|nr:hypothetical protein TNCV_479401 [Trichonephila clavipes]